MEKEHHDTLNPLFEAYEKQKRIDAVSDWEQLRKRIVHYRNRRLFFNCLRNAAAILFPLFLVYQYAFYPILKKNGSAVETITITSAPGMVTKTILSDGSEVWLNAQSSLTYPQRFTEKDRTVQLSGEAYFKVVSDKKHPFNVQTRPGGMRVTACGTEFNVNAYASEKQSEVSLATGSVTVSAKGSFEGKILKVGEKAVVCSRSGDITVSPTDTYVDTAWKDGKMVFRREKLDKIAEKLSRKFGVDICLDGTRLAEYEYTATFTDETLEDILDLLKRSSPITYSISKQKQLDNETFTRRKVTVKLR